MNVTNSIKALFVARTVNAVIGFAATILFARMLGAGGIGTFFLFQAAVGVLSIISDLGVRGAAEKRISEGVEPGSFLSASIVVKLVLFVMLSSLLILFSGHFGGFVPERLISYVVIGIFLQEFSQLLIQNLNAEHRVSSTAPILVTRQLIWLVGGALLIKEGYGTIGIIISYLGGQAVVIVILGYMQETSMALPSLHHIRSLINYAKYDVILSSGYNLFSWLDVLIIGFFLTPEFVGAYEIAWKVGSISVLLSRSVYTTIFPHISSLDLNEDCEEISNLASDMILPSVYLVIPALFGVIALGPQILGIVFGAEYTLASGVLVVFMLQKLIVSYDNVINRTLQALDFPELAAGPMVLGILMNIFLNFVLVWQFGIIGGAVATFFSTLGMAVYRLQNLRATISLTLIPSGISVCIIGSMSMLLILEALQLVIQVNSAQALVGSIILGTIWYVLVTFTSKDVKKIIKSA